MDTLLLEGKGHPLLYMFRSWLRACSQSKQPTVARSGVTTGNEALIVFWRCQRSSVALTIRPFTSCV